MSTITRDDIEAKLREIKGEVEETAEQAKPIALAVGIVVAVAVVGLAFAWGKRKGRKRSTVVEIRRV
jgi:hypothetical protein